MFSPKYSSEQYKEFQKNPKTYIGYQIFNAFLFLIVFKAIFWIIGDLGTSFGILCLLAKAFK